MPTDSRSRRMLAPGVAALAALLLVGAGTLHYQSVKVAWEQEARGALDRYWGAMKGYLRLEHVAPTGLPVSASWYYDDRDSDESKTVNGIRDRCLIMDESGRVIHEPASFQPIRNHLAAQLNMLDSAERTVWVIRSGNVTYMVRTGVLFDDRRSSRYSAALANPLHRNRDSSLVLELSLFGVFAGAFLLGWATARSPCVPQPNRNTCLDPL